MKRLLAVSALLVVIATIVAFAPATASSGLTSEEKVPVISVTSVDLGNSAFSSSESFLIHTGKMSLHRTGSMVSLYYNSNIISPINDTISFNYSIHLSKNPITVNFPVHNGMSVLSFPSGKSYLSTFSVDGNTSYTYLTLVETIPAQSISNEGHPVNNSVQFQNSDFYNITIEYRNASFVIHSPGLVQVGKVFANVTMLVSISNLNGNAILKFSFPLKDGSFSFKFNQIVSSGESINNGLIGSPLIPGSGFLSPFLQNIRSNMISLGVGSGIFLALIIGVYLYYRKK